MDKVYALRQAIAALQAQAAVLGDAALAAAVEPLQAQLDDLRGDGWRTGTQRLRLVTVLFCDVVGSTDMARRLDPEDVHAVMDTALAQLSYVIEGHGGRVLQYAGDSILAVFGADTSQEEDPRYAVRAGLELLAAAKRYSIEAQTAHGVSDFDVRVGIHTGQVLLGAGVDRHNSIRGMPVNIAARMEQSAPKGGLRISHATYRQVRGIFDVVAQPPIAVKGVERPVRSYLVRSERDNAMRTAARGVDGIEVPLVGREAELENLKAARRSLDGVESPGAHLIVVSAEAGMGKSRLADEFELWAATREGGSVILQGRAQPPTRHQPYGLLRSFFVTWLRIRGSDTAQQAREKFLHSAAELCDGPVDDDLRLLAHVIGLDDGQRLASSLGDPKVVRERAFRAATRCVIQQLDPTARPIVMILDDLHWADDDSLAWLTELVQSAARARLLVIAMTRPQLLQRRRGWPGPRVVHDVLQLDPLPADACAGLVNELLRRLRTIPEALRDRLVGAADGNPFYLEERVKILLDEGAIVSDGDAWRLVPDKLLETRLPDTLTGVLQARLDRLSKAERRTLRQASIVGHVFWDEALAAIDPRSLDQLDALCRRELIVRRTESTLDGATEYVFHHHTLHQVAGNSVLKSDRTHYNRCIGGWLEQRTRQRPGEFHGRIAGHFERGDEQERALQHYVLGAEAAVARHSTEAVLRYVDRALRLASQSDLDSRWRLHVAREAMLATTGDRQAHDSDLLVLTRIAEANGDDGKRARARWRNASALSQAGRYPEALQTATEAAQLAQACGDEALAASVAAVRAIALRRLNYFDQAKQVAERGLAQARACGSLGAQKELLYSLAALAAESGRLEEADDLDDTYVQLARDTGDRSAEALGENLTGDARYRLGDLQQARVHFERSVALAQRIRYPYVECIASLNLALLANAQGRYGDALRHARTARPPLHKTAVAPTSRRCHCCSWASRWVVVKTLRMRG